MNADGDSSNGCESPCDDGTLWCRDFQETSCVGVRAAHAHCDLEQTLEGRSFSLYRWSFPDDLRWGSIVDVGSASFMDGELHAAQVRRADLRLQSRGTARPDEVWSIASTSTVGLELDDGTGTVTLRVPRRSDAAVLVGVQEASAGSDASMWVLVEEEEALPRQALRGEHVLWLVSPWSERPQTDGVDIMAWGAPAQLPLLRMGTTQIGSATDAIIPLVETRSEVRGSIHATQSQVRTRTQQAALGLFEVAFYRQGRQQAQPDKLLFGQATRDGFMAVGAARFGRSWCPASYHRVGLDCVHDPTVFVSVQRTIGTQVSSGAYDGVWRLVGWSTSITDDGLSLQTIDQEVGFRGTEVIGPGLVGTLDRYPQGASPIPGALRLRVQGEGVPGGAIELEGHVDPDQRYGVFWDQTGASRSLRGSLYFLLQQEP